ncbi:MAG: putative alpha/beta-hydrolase family hydrolase [Myxococcota bacterium]
MRAASTLVFGSREADPWSANLLTRLEAAGVTIVRVAEDASVLAAASRPDRFLGGFSRGARFAVEAAEIAPPRGLILFGYPFHPKGRPTELDARDRLAHITVPTLVIQGARDVHGNRQQIRDVGPNVTVTWLADGNHRFVPRLASPQSPVELLNEAVRGAAAFMAQLSPQPDS